MSSNYQSHPECWPSATMTAPAVEQDWQKDAAAEVRADEILRMARVTACEWYSGARLEDLDESRREDVMQYCTAAWEEGIAW